MPLQGSYFYLKQIIYLREKCCIIFSIFFSYWYNTPKLEELNLRAGIMYFDLVKTKLLLLSPTKFLFI